MKKNSLTTALVAGLAGVAGLANVATAVNLNPDGLGQVLIFPYYTVNGDNATLVSVVNTTNEVKAVKVRFLEAKNSREVLDFNLYLSPFDVWTGAVVDNGGGTTAARLFTNDTSCTVPAIPAAGVDFRNFAYTGSFNDDAENDLGRTREGHIEMIEMGVVDETVSAAVTGYQAAAIHGGDPDGVGAGARATPSNCARLVASWSGNLPANNWGGGGSAIDVRGPTGGLFGAGIIADVSNGSALSYNADAIDGFYLLGDASLHTNPGNILPSLSNAATGVNEADSIVFDNGSLITLDFASGGPNAVSSIFMHDNIYNEYNTVDGFSDSEWVVTFPTKRLHIEGATAGRRLPFANDADNAGDDLQFDASGYCEPIGIRYFDREEQETGVNPGSVDFSPPPEADEPPGTNLCWEANVITFNQEAEVTAGTSAVLGSRFANNINLVDIDGSVFNEGWLAMAVGNANNFIVDGNAVDGVTPRNQLFGLPLTGFWAANFVNANAAPGILANYAAIVKHRASRSSRSVTVDGTGAIVATGFAAS